MEANGTPPKHTGKYSSVPNTRNHLGLSQAYMIRNAAADKALVLRGEEPDDLKGKVAVAKALKDLAHVWANASERIRILRGKPMPGSFRPKAPVKKRKAPTGPLFSMEEDTPAEPSTRADSAPPDVPPQP